MSRKLILVFLAGCLASLFFLHLILTYSPARAEVWEKGNALLVFNRHKDAYPYWWAYSPTRNSYADEFRKGLVTLGWTRPEKIREIGDYSEVCFFEFSRNSLGGAFFKLHTTEKYPSGYENSGGVYTARRYQSHDLNNLRDALQMCR